MMANNPRAWLVVILGGVSLMLMSGAGSQTAPPASTGPAKEPQLEPRSPQPGPVYVPESSKPQPGSHAHTNYLLRGAKGGKKPAAVQTPSEGAFGGPRPQ